MSTSNNPSCTTATVKGIKSSVYKARIVADFIRSQAASSKKAHEILDALRFVKKKVARDFYKLLHSCMNNAQTNDNRNLRNLLIREVYVNKDFCLKRSNIHGRGRRSMKRKPFVRLFISVGSA